MKSTTFFMNSLHKVSRLIVLIACVLCLALACGCSMQTTKKADSSSQESAVQEQNASADGEATAAEEEGSGGSSGKQDPTPSANKITVRISIDSSEAHEKESSWPASMGSYTVELNEGASVLDALEATGVKISSRGNTKSKYVVAINSLAEKAIESSSGWVFTVNGTRDSRSCAQYTLNDGDNVEWSFTLKGFTS